MGSVGHHERSRPRSSPRVISRFPDFQSAADVAVCSFPRSGNTWMRFLLAHLFWPGVNASLDNIGAFVPDIYQTRAVGFDFEGVRFFKTHGSQFEKYPRTIYMKRSQLDALFSYYEYHRDQKRFRGTFLEYLKGDLTQSVTGCSWKEHVTKAETFFCSQPNRIIIVSYEDLKMNPLNELKKITAFLKMEVEEKIVIRAIGSCEIGHLKRAHSKNQNSFKRGVPGYWRTQVAAEDQQVIEKISAGLGSVCSQTDSKP